MTKFKGGSIFHLLLLTGLFCCLTLSAAKAAEKVTVSAVDDGRTGRLVLDWGHVEPFSTEMEGGYLYIRFTRAFDADLSDVPAMLGKYLGAGEMLEGRQSVRFPVKGEVTVASETRDGKIILKLQGQADKTADTTAAGKVRLRSGEHADFSRLVFDWPKGAVKHMGRLSGNDLVITFNQAADIDLGAINKYPPAHVRKVSEAAKDGKTVVTIAMDPGSRFSSFENQKSIIYDIRGGAKPAATAGKKAPEEPKVAAVPIVQPKVEPLPEVKKAAAKPAPSSVASVPAKTEAPQKSAGTHDKAEDAASKEGKLASISPASGSAIARIGPTIVLDPDPQKEDVKAAGMTEEKVADAPASAPAVKTPEDVPHVEQAAVKTKADEGAADAALNIRIANLRDGFRLIFPWKRPVAMAMFENHGAYWVVFDRPARADFGNLDGPYKFLVSDAEQEAGADSTILRFRFREGYIPRISKVNEDWHIDFELGTKVSYEQAITAQAQNVITSGLRLFVPAVQNGHEVRFTDPEAGSNLVVMPLHSAGWGMASLQEFKGISLLPTVQGIAMETKDASLQITPEQNGVSVVAVSNTFQENKPEKQDVPKLPGEEMNPVPGLKAATFVKLAQWRQVDPALFTLRKQELQKDIAAAKEKNKLPAMMTLAKFYVGHGFYAEASGVLRHMKARRLRIGGDRDFRLLSGLAALGLHHLKEAENFLYDGSFDGNAEVAPWRGVVAAEKGNWVRAAQELDYSAAAFGIYSQKLQNRFNLLRAQAALKNGDVDMAKKTLEAMRTPKDKALLAEKSYLQGLLDYQSNNFHAAAAQFDQAIKINYRPVTERARYQKINTDLVSKQITPEKAIKELEALDFAWRGDELEVDIQRRLGNLYEKDGEVGNALAAYKRVVRNFPDSQYASELGKKMNDLFANLFLNGGADKLPPIKALAIYYQYRELTPVGHQGDKMIQQLADRLARVDLLEQAAQLLEHQVNFRLKGEEKANVGTRLAIIQLWNKKPGESLKALYKTKWVRLPLSVKQERLHIEARAQAGLKHYDEALNLLADDKSEEADVLRAEIYWKSKNWPQAIPALEQLIGKGHSTVAEDLDRLDRQRIMQLAVARNLANDKRGIKAMRKTYRKKMVGTPDLAAFDLITETNDKSDAKFRERASVIAEVSQLESFMAGYRQKLEKGDFWTAD